MSEGDSVYSLTERVALMDEYFTNLDPEEFVRDYIEILSKYDTDEGVERSMSYEEQLNMLIGLIDRLENKDLSAIDEIDSVVIVSEICRYGGKRTTLVFHEDDDTLMSKVKYLLGRESTGDERSHTFIADILGYEYTESRGSDFLKSDRNITIGFSEEGGFDSIRLAVIDYLKKEIKTTEGWGKA